MQHQRHYISYINPFCKKNIKVLSLIFIFQCKEHANEAVEMLAYVI